MIKKIDHIGIIVKDIESSLEKYRNILGLDVKETEEVKVEGAMNRVDFLPVGSINIELIHTNAISGIAAAFLRERGEGIHHVAFEVSDLEKTFSELREKGIKFLWDKIIKGSRGSVVAFLEPEEMNGVYIELVQKKIAEISR